MNNEQLIEFVRKHVELYDSSHAKYRDGNYKEKVWKEISENIKQPITACKRRWNNMRDNYRKSRKRRITKSEQDGQFKIIRYKYEDQLRFLDPFLKDRNNSIITSESNEVLSEQASPVERADVNDDNNDKNETITAARTDILEITESKSLKSRHKKPLSSASRRKSKRVKSEIASPQSTVSDTASSTLVKYILEKNDSKNVAEASHPVDTFLSGIAPTLKSLNSYYLNITKTKIFTIVQEAEMTQIMEQRTQCRMRNARSGTEQQRYSSNSEYSRTPSPRFMHVTLQSPSPESYDSHPRS